MTCIFSSTYLYGAVHFRIPPDNGIKLSAPDDATRAQVVKVAEQMWADFTKRVPEAAPVIAAYRQMVKK